jgi:uncharacterized protein (DUF1501 family)
MNRRNFLSQSAALSLPLFLKGLPLYASNNATHPLVEGLNIANCGKVLIIVQLHGGNDGLNTIIPVDRYSELTLARPSVLIASNKVLTLNGNTTTGLHPSLGGIKELYDEGKVNIVQGVSYPNPNFSHFQAQDIWYSGDATIPTASTGWLGRQLDLAYPEYPDIYPTAQMPDPLSIQIGGGLPLSLQGPSVTMAYNSPDPNALINVANATTGDTPSNEYGTELRFLRLMIDQSNAYTTSITNAYRAQQTLFTSYPTSNPLADQLKVVARLIGGGLKTPVYVVNHYGFDTHVGQVNASDTATGFHANLLKQLGDAIAAFQKDITLMGLADKVTGMTYSEFGRRVVSNTSSGSDHGSGAPVLFFGASIIGGQTGTSPIIPATSNSNTQVPMQHDFRQLYASVIQNWFCMTDTQSSNVLGGDFETLPIFNSVSAPLPINDIVLKTKWNNNAVAISFEVFENERFEYFSIQKSIDGIDFENIQSIYNTNDRSIETYNYIDEYVNWSLIYYKIIGYEKQGGRKNSKIVAVKNENKQQVSVYPNPVENNIINIDFHTNLSQYVDFYIVGVLGETLFYDKKLVKGKSATLHVPNMFDPNTIYILNINFNGMSITEKILFK